MNQLIWLVNASNGKPICIYDFWERLRHDSPVFANIYITQTDLLEGCNWYLHFNNPKYSKKRVYCCERGEAAIDIETGKSHVYGTGLTSDVEVRTLTWKKNPESNYSCRVLVHSLQMPEEERGKELQLPLDDCVRVLWNNVFSLWLFWIYFNTDFQCKRLF